MKTKIVKCEITFQLQDLIPVWRDSDNSDYELNSLLKYVFKWQANQKDVILAYLQLTEALQLYLAIQMPILQQVVSYLVIRPCSCTM